MNELDATRIGDEDLINTYLNMVDIEPNGKDVEVLKLELEERDILFEGFRLYGEIPGIGFTCPGCWSFFDTLEALKDYIVSSVCSGLIEPTENASMRYVVAVKR